MNIICYTGGTCGDMLAAVIDNCNVELTNTRMSLSKDRQRLKKPHSFKDDLEKNQYVNDMGLLYNSIPSHDLDYHIRCQHNFISITVKEFDVALWAATRFKQMHQPHVWEEMQRVCGADTIEMYAQRMIDFSNLVSQHTKKTIKLERILTGHAIEDLSQWISTTLDNNLYQTWLTSQNLSTCEQLKL